MSREAILETLRNEQGEMERYRDTLILKLSKVTRDIAVSKDMLSMYLQDVPPEHFLPHMSIRRLISETEKTALCVEALQGAEALDTREIALFVMRKKGLDVGDQALLKRFVFSVQWTLRSKRRKGLFVSEEKRRRGARVWSLRKPR